MRRVLLRVVMAILGISALAVYAGGAYLSYLLLRFVWVDRPSAVAIVLVAVSVTLLLGFVSYRFGTRGLLESMPAVEPPETRRRTFEERLARLCERMDIDEPAVRFTDLGEPNAFAVSGPGGGVVVFDIALFELLDDDGFETILAHELAHLESHDSLVQLLAFTGLQTVVGAMSLAILPAILLLTGVAKASALLRGQPGSWSRSLAWKFRTIVVVAVMVLPIVVTFVLLVRSRRREYAADERAAEVTGKPLALASALSTVHDAMVQDLRVQGFLPDARDPVGSDPLYRLLSTHPAVEVRIERLKAMANT